MTAVVILFMKLKWQHDKLGKVTNKLMGPFFPLPEKEMFYVFKLLYYSGQSF